MAAGVFALSARDKFTKTNVQFWTGTTNGAGPTLINPGMTRILFCFPSWTEKIGPVASTLEPIISSDTKTITLTNTAGLTKTASLMIVGF